MFKAKLYIFIVAGLLGIADIYGFGIANAQIAPTNSATISGSVDDSAGKPVANAAVSLSGPKNAATKTDSLGLFVFIGMPFGTYQISAAAVDLGTATRSIAVQGDTNVAIQYEPVSVNGLKTIAHVSSAANAQFNVTPASITQVSPIANAFEGKTSWRTILEQIPGVAQAGLRTGDLNTSSEPDSPSVPMQISINGALPYETATLLDDMPLIAGTAEIGTEPGSGTDLQLYPLNGFTSADVIRGPGANAPSIVDSIGGSFVLHSPSVVNANHYELSLSTDPYGGVIVNALAAMRWKKLSVTITYGVNPSPGPLSNAAPAAGAYTYTSVNGTPFSCLGGSCFTYRYNPNYANGGFEGIQSTNLLLCCIGQNTSWNEHSGSLALDYAVTPAVNVKVFYAGEISNVYCPPAFYNTTFDPPAGYSGGIAAGNYNFNSNSSNYLELFPTQRISSLLEEQITAQIGRGTLRLAALQNRAWSSSALTTPGTLNLQLFGGGCLDTGTTSPGCPTGYQATAFNGQTYSVGLLQSSTHYFSGSNNRDLLLNYTTPLGENFHAGVSFVQSYYNRPGEEFAVAGAPYNYTFNIPTASAISETTKETRVFIGGNLSEKTSLDLSMYFANADYHVPNPNGGAPIFTIASVGGITQYSCSLPSSYIDARYSYAAPRLGFVWRPNASVAVRASAGGGFAEAPLSDLIGSSGLPDCTNGVYCTVSLTNTSLQPEKSFAFDLGTDVRLPHDTVVSLDVYRSNLYGQLYNSTSFSSTCPTCGNLPLYTTQYGNLGVSRFEGILVDLHHDVPRGLNWSFSGGLTRGYVVSLPGGFYNTAGGTCVRSTGVNCQNLSVVTNVNFNGTFAASVPYAQAHGGLGYHWNPDKYIDLVGTYYGNNNTYYRPAFIEFDGHVGYPLTKQTSLLVTFRNITGVNDGAFQIYSPALLSVAAPSYSGPPTALYGQEYGPRTVLMTLNLNM